MTLVEVLAIVGLDNVWSDLIIAVIGVIGYYLGKRKGKKRY